MHKILTIIVPTYNMENYLGRCLDSLILPKEQMYLLEVLIINDGSKDNSLEIARQYEKMHPETFHVIDKENGNYGSCINRGLAEAKGKYIKVLDSDDTFDNEAFPLFVNFLTNSDVDCVISDMIQLDMAGNKILKTSFNLPYSNSFKLSDMDFNVVRNMWMHCVCYKTENIRRIGYKQTEGISYTDQEWICVPMSTAKSLAYFPKVLYQYLVGRDGQTINPNVWEKNFWQEIKGAVRMIEERNNLYPDCSDEGIAYIDARIRKRVDLIYNVFFLLFTTFENNEEMKKLDFVVYHYNSDFYESLNKKTYYCFSYIKYWRKSFDIFATRNRIERMRKVRDVIKKISGIKGKKN